MKDLRGYLKYLNYGFAAVILSLLIFSAIDYAKGTPPFFVVSDNPSSMSPTIDYGDAVMVYKVSFDSLDVGDIIVFKDPRGIPLTVIHRVVEVDTEGSHRYLLTKGDNDLTNPTIDPWEVTEEDYISKAILIIPAAGYISPSLWGTGGLLVVLAITIVVLVIFLFGPRKDKASDSEEPQAEKPQEPVQEGGC
ncbi:MAG: signal peptidase I [Methanobacteriota archaeon]|nr:MAG: signal peptidase I [Euryarchaeota archaeon]